MTETKETATRRLILQPSFLSNESYALLLIFLFSICYSLMGTFIKLAAATGRVLPLQLTFLRSCTQGIIVVTAMCFVTTTTSTTGEESSSEEQDAGYHEMEERSSPTNNNNNEKQNNIIRLIQQPFGPRNVLPIVLARGLIGGFGLLLYFYTMASIPLGDAASVLSLSSIITVVASSLLLDNEPLSGSVVAAAICSVIGSTLIAKPTFLFGMNNENEDIDNDTDQDGIVNSFGYVTGLLGSCTAAAVVMLVRKAGTTGKGGVHTLQLLFSWCLFGSLYSSVLMCLFVSGNNSMTLNDDDNNNDASSDSDSSNTTRAFPYYYIIAMCFFGLCGHFLMNYAGQHAPAGLASIVRSSLILWGYLLEVCIFNHIPDGFTVLGALLILSSLIVVAWQKFRGGSKKTKEENTTTKETTLIEVTAPTTLANGGGTTTTTTGVLT